MFHGAIVAIVTPFRNGRLDASALKKLVEFQIRSGTDGIVPCGTTGESATLSYEEHERVIDLVLDAAGGRVPVIAGTGSNNTKEAVLLTRYAKKAGADAALVITPYYNKPTQAGLIAHFREVAASADIPLILYNVPSRTGVNMTAETVARLSERDGRRRRALLPDARPRRQGGHFRRLQRGAGRDGRPLRLLRGG
jgi:4-hydroxy-tetrahydrodipicolinate synthase